MPPQGSLGTVEGGSGSLRGQREGGSLPQTTRPRVTSTSFFSLASFFLYCKMASLVVGEVTSLRLHTEGHGPDLGWLGPILSHLSSLPLPTPSSCP